MNEKLFKLLKSELKEILGEDDFTIIEMNKGSFHIIITLQFVLKKMKNATAQVINNITKRCKNFIGKIKDFAFFGNKKKVKNSNSLIKNIEDCEKDIIQAFEEKCKGTPINELTNFYELSKSFSTNDFNELYTSSK